MSVGTFFGDACHLAAHLDVAICVVRIHDRQRNRRPLLHVASFGAAFGTVHPDHVTIIVEPHGRHLRGAVWHHRSKVGKRLLLLEQVEIGIGNLGHLRLLVTWQTDGESAATRLLGANQQARNLMQTRSISFFSEGVRLAGTLFAPADLRTGERRAGIVLGHGYTGVRDLYLPDIARVLCEAGFAVLTFDYKGWGDSDGPKSRLAPYSRVIDAQSAVTWLGAQEFVDPERLGIYGTSYGGATVVWVAAVDPRVKCVVSVVGVGNGQRWMRSVRRPDEYNDLLQRSAEDRVRRVMEGHSALAERTEILLPDRQSAELAAAARQGNPGAVSQIPLEFIDDTLGFNAEW